MISQIEQDLSSPSVASLKRILDVIPMTMSQFFAAEEQDQEQTGHRALMPELIPQQ